MVRGLIALICVSFFISCDNSLDLLEDKKEIPVIYSFLDAQDTAHYVRVERAFADPNIPAADLAQDPTNLYYDDLDVYMTINGGTPFVLDRVDGDAEGYPKTGGAFATSPNYLYKTKRTIKSQDVVNITMKDESKDIDVRTETTILKEVLLKNFFEGKSISIDPDIKLSLEWNSGSDAKVFGLFWDIYYKETIAGETTKKSFRWVVDDYIDVPRYRLDGTKFYQAFVDNIEVNPDAQRKFSSISIHVIGGDQAIQTYTNVGLANLGITSSGETPSFSNVEGGLGLVASTYHSISNDIYLKETSLKTLSDGDITKALNFE